MQKEFDVIVLGLGAMGCAATHQLARSGAKVLGIDRFSPPHINGSSHGDTRITRQAIGEGAEYVPLVLRSYEIWRQIEEETGRSLLNINGGLIISSGAKTAINHVENFFENTVAAAEEYSIDHQLFTADQIRQRFPQFNVKDNEEGYFENNAGYLRPEECIRSQLELARKNGADVHLEEKVLGYKSKQDKVMVRTDKGEYEANKLIITVGPWLPELLEDEYRRYFRVSRQVLYWFKPKGSLTPFLPENFPIFIWELQGNNQGIYGFPIVEGVDGVKIATEQYKTTTTPETVDRDVSPEEIRDMYTRYVEPYFPGLSENCVKAISCLYTVTPDSAFVIDTHPQHDNVILVSPCSGHGFKHSAAIGEVLAQLVTDGKSKIDISKFGLKRFDQ